MYAKILYTYKINVNLKKLNPFYLPLTILPNIEYFIKEMEFEPGICKKRWNIKKNISGFKNVV